MVSVEIPERKAERIRKKGDILTSRAKSKTKSYEIFGLRKDSTLFKEAMKGPADEAQRTNVQEKKVIIKSLKLIKYIKRL